MWVFCYSNIIGGILFICIALFLKLHYKYVESFVLLRPSKVDNNKLNDEKMELTVEDYLLKQIEDDPNKTQIEKKVITDITQKYFLNSDKLAKLKKFNNDSNMFKIA